MTTTDAKTTRKAAAGTYGWGEDGLTDRQRETLAFIIDHAVRHLYQPSYREINDHFGLSSPTGVVATLKALEAKGWVRVVSRRSRGIEILRRPGAAPGESARGKAAGPGA